MGHAANGLVSSVAGESVRLVPRAQTFHRAGSPGAWTHILLRPACKPLAQAHYFRVTQCATLEWTWATAGSWVRIIYVWRKHKHFEYVCIQQGDTFHMQLTLKFKEYNSETLHLEYRFVCCWNMDTSESISGICGRFWNVVLEKDEDQLDRSCEKYRSVTQSRRRRITYAQKERGENKKERLTGFVTSFVGTGF